MKKLKKVLIILILTVGLISITETILRIKGYKFLGTYLNMNRKIFEYNEFSKKYETARDIRSAFPGHHPVTIDQEFYLQKEPGSLRIIIIGDSVVKGLDEVIDNLKFCLSNKLKRKVEIINMGFSSCGSSRSKNSAIEAMKYNPDIMIIYTGHSDFVSMCNPETYLTKNGKPGRNLSPSAKWLFENLRLAQVAAKIYSLLMKPSYQGLRHYRENEKKKFYHQFVKNMETIAKLPRRENAPKVKIFFSKVAYNYLVPMEENYNKISDEYYNKGKMKFEQGEYEKAKQFIDLAFVYNSSPRRVTMMLNRMIENVAVKYNIPIIDIKKVIDNASLHNMGDTTLFTDHCHFNLLGNKLVVQEFCRAITGEEV